MKLLSFVFLAMLGLSLQAQTGMPEGLRSISEENARAHIEFLADDLLEGRAAGSRGSRIAARYIASCLKSYGIQPFSDSSYYQPFDADYQNQTLHLNNIIGRIEGAGKDEYIIVGAHYDHLGIDSTQIGDQIFNGADDNASGVSAVLQIAKAFALTGERPERTILFAFWDGEERKLLGSDYFTRTHPDLSKVKGYLNFDMIGRNHMEYFPAHVDYFFAEEHPELSEWLKEAIHKFKLNLIPTYMPAPRDLPGSDNVSFAQKGVPIIWFHTDGHPDYHQPTDHSDKLNWNKITEITKAAYLITWKWANPANNLPR